MIPLRITAHLSGAICLQGGPIALDSMLAAQVAVMLDLPPILDSRDIVPIEIPIEKEPDGRFHLASISLFDVERFEKDWTNRRFPIAEAQMFGDEMKTFRITAGATKSHRLPRQRMHLTGDRITWFAIGDPTEIEAILRYVHHIGKKRSVGLGEVRRWIVEPCEAWMGFPVATPDGLPLRNLPLDWPGLSTEAERAIATLTYPYWDHSRDEMLAVPALLDGVSTGDPSGVGQFTREAAR